MAIQLNKIRSYKKFNHTTTKIINRRGCRDNIAYNLGYTKNWFLKKGGNTVPSRIMTVVDYVPWLTNCGTLFCLVPDTKSFQLRTASWTSSVTAGTNSLYFQFPKTHIPNTYYEQNDRTCYNSSQIRECSDSMYKSHFLVGMR